MDSQKFDLPSGPAPGVDLRNDPDIMGRDLDMSQFTQPLVEYPAHMPGGQHDLEPRGLTAETYEPVREQHTDPRPTEATYTQDWQRLYGNEANEKGQWRRAAEDALAELQQAKAELAALRTAPQVMPPAYPYQVPQVQAPPPIPRKAAIPERFFEKDAEELVTVADAERVFKEQIAPAVATIWEQQQLLQELHVNARKASAGITPQVEHQLTQLNPWLNNMDPASRADALVSLAAQARAAQQAAPPRPAPVAPSRAPSPTEVAANRRVYVEGTRQGNIGEPQTQEQVMQQEIAGAMAKPWGAQRAEALRQVYAKYGIGPYNDFGPGVYSR